MASRTIFSLVAAVAGFSPALASTAWAHQDDDDPALYAQAQQQPQNMPEPYGPPPIPPNTEGQAISVTGGAYCYGGPHPQDTRVSGGDAWDGTDGQHTHFYPPFDLRLFTLRNGCYYFVGDPTDFGYRGSVYSYYGAHPVLDHWGGGWCFMIGGHSHFWRPWSSHFVSFGPWWYWHGPYDPWFWSYWPYYSYYYRSYYPHYYGGGRWHRGGGGRGRSVAPAIGRVPTPAGWNGGMASSGEGWRGVPPTGGTAPSPGPGGAATAAAVPNARPADTRPSAGWRGVPQSSSPNSGFNNVGRPSGPSPGATRGVDSGHWGGFSGGGVSRPAPSAAPAPRSAPAWSPGAISPSRSFGGGFSGGSRAAPSSGGGGGSRSSGPAMGGGIRSGGSSGWRK